MLQFGQSEIIRLSNEEVAVPGRAVLVCDRATCLVELGRMDEAKRLLDDAAPEVRERFPRKVFIVAILNHRSLQRLGDYYEN